MHILKLGMVRPAKTTAASLSVIVAAAVAVFAIVMITRKQRVEVPVLEPHTAQSSFSAEHPVRSPARGSVSQICFERNDSIYIKDLATGKERKVAVGRSSDLSPSGEEVAFMSGKVIEDTRAPSEPWRLKVLNLRTNETRDFPALANIDTWQPLWSHDGSKIAFRFLKTETRGGHLGILDVSTGTWKDISLSKSFEGLNNLGSWTLGDQSIVVNSFDYFYEIGVDGKVLQKIALGDLSENGFSTSTRFSLSRDKRYLLFSQGIADGNEAVFTYDLVTKKLSQVTPNTIEAWRPIWFGSDNAILFTCITVPREPYTRSICKVAVDGSDLKVIAKDADYPSYSFR